MVSASIWRHPRPGPVGRSLANPPLLEALAFDPILGKCKLIAEAWDAGGLYQVGSFPAYGRWAEWNGKYRDTVRKFLKGEPGETGAMSQAVQGWPEMYHSRGRRRRRSISSPVTTASTLADLVSYNDKHNEANGEDNRDAANDNASWNCGWEGHGRSRGSWPCAAPDEKRMAMLLVSQGVPMILMGDEVGQSKLGNNNTYGLDTEVNWLDWSLLEKNTNFYRFVKNMIAFRRRTPY